MLYDDLKEDMIAYPTVTNFPLCEYYFVHNSALYVVQTSQESKPRDVSIQTIHSFLEKVNVPDNVNLFYLYVPMPDKVNDAAIQVVVDVTSAQKEVKKRIRYVYEPAIASEDVNEGVTLVKNDILFAVVNIPDLKSLLKN